MHARATRSSIDEKPLPTPIDAFYVQLAEYLETSRPRKIVPRLREAARAFDAFLNRKGELEEKLFTTLIRLKHGRAEEWNTLEARLALTPLSLRFRRIRADIQRSRLRTVT